MRKRLIRLVEPLTYVLASFLAKLITIVIFFPEISPIKSIAIVIIFACEGYTLYILNRKFYRGIK